MKEKSSNRSNFASRRCLLCPAIACLIVIVPLLVLSHPRGPATAPRRALTFEERVACQRAIEEIYWRHRIWPKESPDSKPSLDAVMSQSQIEKKVTDYLGNSKALEDYWQHRITAEQLQAEMDRMAHHTKQPAVLRELFEALGNDPFIIAECLARPALAERLVTSWYAYDQTIHGELRQRAEANLHEHPTVERMKRLSGIYTEIELIKSDNAEVGNSDGIERSLKLNIQEWDATAQKLAAVFGDPAAEAGEPDAKAAFNTQIKTGVLSPLQEDEGSYYAMAVIEKTAGRLRLATVAWLKEPFESWRANAVENETSKTTVAAPASYSLPAISDEASGCTDNTWAASSLNIPSGRNAHTAVWTGTEMIIWGGAIGYPATPFGTGGRYNPSTGAWTTVSTLNAPSERGGHTAVWTGTEMIVWGGGWLNSGGRYNPITDSWIPTSSTNAPTARSGHTAVWTGSEMIVWGGYSGTLGYLNTGGRYNPNSNSWTATSTANAPAPRDYHTVVWTGGQMIVWGGEGTNGIPLSTGGRYNPITNSWAATSTVNAPIGRELHTAVWTGGQMLIWGGSAYNDYYLTTGGRYNPITNSWTATSTANSPAGRYYHTAVWTGSEMIVWGGASSSGYVNTGGKYNPGTNSWTTTTITNAPPRRWDHTAVWTGGEMIVWGGIGDGSPGALNTFGRYNPSTNTWAAGQPPTGRIYHTAVWTGSEMIVWGGDDGLTYLFAVNSGGKYDLATDNWTPTSTIYAPSPRRYHTAVWTGTEMIVWGGFESISMNTGGRYNPITNSWRATSTANAPRDRSNHAAVWTGSKMIVWGGNDSSGNYFNTGGIYNPSVDRWATTSTTNAPSARAFHTAIWAGQEMIVWGGGQHNGIDMVPVNTGGRYNPDMDRWTITSTTTAPIERLLHTAVWTGSEMIVWGGAASLSFVNAFNTGGRYDPATDSWITTNTTNVPEPRADQTAVWTGSEMIVWGGGSSFPYYLNTGGRYNPERDTWTATSGIGNTPIGRYWHTAVWTGNGMIVWGGVHGGVGYLNNGGRYCAESSPTPMPTPAPRPTVRPRPSLPPRQTPPPR